MDRYLNPTEQQRLEDLMQMNSNRLYGRLLDCLCASPPSHVATAVSATRAAQSSEHSSEERPAGSAAEHEAARSRAPGAGGQPSGRAVSPPRDEQAETVGRSEGRETKVRAAESKTERQRCLVQTFKVVEHPGKPQRFRGHCVQEFLPLLQLLLGPRLAPANVVAETGPVQYLLEGLDDAAGTETRSSSASVKQKLGEEKVAEEIDELVARLRKIDGYLEDLVKPVSPPATLNASELFGVFELLLELRMPPPRREFFHLVGGRLLVSGWGLALNESQPLREILESLRPVATDGRQTREDYCSRLRSEMGSTLIPALAGGGNDYVPRPPTGAKQPSPNTAIPRGELASDWPDGARRAWWRRMIFWRRRR